MKWVLLTTAPDQLLAEMWRDLLVEEGLNAVIRTGDAVSFLGVSAYPCRILVTENQLEQAREILENRLGKDRQEL